MTTLNGVFALRTPRDLVAKLEADYGRMRDARTASMQQQYAAWDFFVTARHLPEWASRANKTVAASADKAVVEHIADGAKHFYITDRRHVSVKDTQVPDAYVNEASMEVYDQPLQVQLMDGSSIGVLQLAQRVFNHWKSEFP